VAPITNLQINQDRRGERTVVNDDSTCNSHERPLAFGDFVLQPAPRHLDVRLFFHSRLEREEAATKVLQDQGRLNQGTKEHVESVDVERDNRIEELVAREPGA
jgi:hypothetical protein